MINVRAPFGFTSPQERAAVVTRVEGMSRDELDGLPVGIITLDLEGTILRFSESEAKLSRRHAEAQIGKNFFRDVAPCCAQEAFEGRFRDLASENANGMVEFDYTFDFPWGREEVLITFMRPLSATRIHVLVTRLSPPEMTI